MATTENILDGLKHLSTIHRSQFDERRKYEWKVFFTTLSLYVLSVAARFSNQVTIPSTIQFHLFIWLFFPLLSLDSIVYLIYIHKANNINKKIAEKVESAIAEVVRGNEIHDIKVTNYNFKVFTWSLFWQLTTLISFSIIAAYLVTS